MSEMPAPAAELPDKTVRITASYLTSCVGDAVVPGHPDSVEIELTGPAIPDGDAADLAEFLAALVDALFRNVGTGDVEIVFNKPESTPSAPAEAARRATAARGGRTQ